MEASLGDNVDLDGGVAARVVDGAGVDLGDGHGSGGEGWSQWVVVTVKGGRGAGGQAI